MPRILVLSALPTIGAAELQDLPTLRDVNPADTTVATFSGRLTSTDLPRSAFDTAVSSGPPAHHTVGLLGTIAAALTPGGKLVVAEGGTSYDSEKLSKNLLLSGFSGVEALPDKPGCFTAQKPSWETGAKAAIALKPRAKTTAPAAAKTWTLNVDADDDDDLVDEEDLLTEEDLKRPAPGAAANGDDDCELGAGGARKACANCTCGRAEGGKPAKLTKDMLENPQAAGGCGSCSLGDAFRCGTCPYRGLPAFEPGKKIEVPSDFLLADIE